MKNHLAIFASGSGTNADAIISYLSDKKTAVVSLIVTNKADAGVIHIAKKHHVPFLVISKEQMFDSGYLLAELQKHSVNWIILAGFLLMIPEYLVKVFENKMVNIHPALLPKFGGKGMYGMKVHESVIQAKEKESGITIHLVNEHYDEGGILFQAKTEILPSDTSEILAEKIHHLEYIYFPKTIEKYILSNI